jgi:septin family protein
MVESPVGVANLPNQLHRILSRKGANLTLMVVGIKTECLR